MSVKAYASTLGMIAVPGESAPAAKRGRPKARSSVRGRGVSKLATGGPYKCVTARQPWAESRATGVAKCPGPAYSSLAWYRLIAEVPTWMWNST